MRDDCLQSIQYGLKEKEHELEEQLSHVKLDMAANAAFMTNEDMNSKKFLLNVLETRLKRQRRHTTETFKKAEAKVNADTRIKKFLH